MYQWLAEVVDKFHCQHTIFVISFWKSLKTSNFNYYILMHCNPLTDCFFIQGARNLMQIADSIPFHLIQEYVDGSLTYRVTGFRDCLKRHDIYQLVNALKI